MASTNEYQLDEIVVEQEEQKVDINIVQQGDDPLLQQLPAELQRYVRRPEEHQGQIVFVQRSPLKSACHSVWSALCCCWSVCRCYLVKEGEIGLTQYGDDQELLPPGRHVILSPTNEWLGTRSYRDTVIKHGPLHIIRVSMGQLGYGMDTETGQPMLLSRGEHVINSISFVFKAFVSFREQITQLDQLQVIRIETGQIGYGYKGGNLVIFNPGLHLISPPDRFADIMSTQMQILDLPLGIHETSDYVGLAIKAALFYRIVSPEKTLVRIKNVRQQISETAVATLAGIIRASSLSDLGSSNTQPFYHEAKFGDEEKKDGYAPAPEVGTSRQQPFYQYVHDEFLVQLHDHCLDEWGVEIYNIRIESLKINDPTLQKNISNNALDVIRQHNKYIMLQKQREIMMVEANTAAAKQRIETDTETQAIRTVAKAQADAVIIKAKAEKNAMQLRGEGEDQYSQLLSQTELGQKMSLMEIQKQALQGLSQVCYIPQIDRVLDSRQAFAQNKLIPDMPPNQNELLG